MGGSAHPSPGPGRKPSCWCSGAVPPLTAPPNRLGLCFSRSPGSRTSRAMTDAENPGACRSITCSISSACARIRAVSPAARCGTWAYAHADSVPAGGAGRAAGGRPAPRTERFAVPVPYPERRPPRVQDAGHRAVALDRPAPIGEPPEQRRGELPRAALRYREANALAEHRQQPPEDRAAGLFRYQIGVQRVAGQQQPPTVAVEALQPVLPHGDDGQPRQAQRRGRGEPAQQPCPGAHRRERPQDRLPEPPPRAVPPPPPPPPPP